LESAGATSDGGWSHLVCKRILLLRQLKKHRSCGIVMEENIEIKACNVREDHCMPGKIERDHWHPGFLGAMEIEFRSYRKHLDFDDEHTLSKEPLKMDLLVIKRKLMP